MLAGGKDMQLREEKEQGLAPSRPERQDFLRWPRSLPARLLQEIPLRSNVYEVYATDKDEGLNGAVRYSFLKTTGNRDWEYFTIDPISGLIQTAQRLDREKQAVYSVRGRGQARGAEPREGLSSGRAATTCPP